MSDQQNLAGLLADVLAELQGLRQDLATKHEELQAQHLAIARVRGLLERIQPEGDAVCVSPLSVPVR